MIFKNGSYDKQESRPIGLYEDDNDKYFPGFDIIIIWNVFQIVGNASRFKIALNSIDSTNTATFGRFLIRSWELMDIYTLFDVSCN